MRSRPNCFEVDFAVAAAVYWRTVPILFIVLLLFIVMLFIVVLYIVVLYIVTAFDQ